MVRPAGASIGRCGDCMVKSTISHVLEVLRNRGLSSGDRVLLLPAGFARPEFLYCCAWLVGLWRF